MNYRVGSAYIEARSSEDQKEVVVDPDTERFDDGQHVYEWNAL